MNNQVDEKGWSELRILREKAELTHGNGFCPFADGGL